MIQRDPLNKEKAIEIMKLRGYSMVSEAGNGSWIGFSKDMNGIWMSAYANLGNEFVDISAGNLKMSCELKVNRFDFFHKDFERFEKWAYFYAKVCGEIEKVVDDLDFIPARVHRANSGLFTVGEVETPKPVKKTIEERAKAFKRKVIEIGKTKGYTPEMCKAFFNYWTEVNDNGKKMRCEIAKSKGGVFSIERRLITWAAKDSEYNSRFLDRKEKTAALQNEELKVKTNDVDKKKLFG